MPRRRTTTSTSPSEPRAPTIHRRAGGGDIRRLKAELARGVSASLQDHAGLTPLHWACREGRLDAVLVLLRAGADLRLQDGAGHRPLDVASWYGHAEVVEALVRRARRFMGPLHRAAVAGDVLRIRAELKAGASVNGRDAIGLTPLHWACRMGHLDATKPLIRAGANIRARDREGNQPLDLAARFGRPDIAELLLRRGVHPDCSRRTGLTPLHIAAALGKVEVAKVLIRRGADVNQRDSGRQGYASLHYAAQEGHSTMVDLLLRHGAAIDAVDHGTTPLGMATAGNHVSAVRLLLDRGADPNVRNPSGSMSTPLHTAAVWTKTITIARMLVAYGADISARDDDAATPAALATRVRNQKLTDFLRKCMQRARTRSGMRCCLAWRRTEGTPTQSARRDTQRKPAAPAIPSSRKPRP